MSIIKPYVRKSVVPAVSEPKPFVKDNRVVFVPKKIQEPKPVKQAVSVPAWVPGAFFAARAAESQDLLARFRQL